MSAPAPVLISRALAATLTAALEDLEVSVHRQREATLLQEELPCILLFQEGWELEEEFAGGRQIRQARFTLEMIDGADPGDVAGDLADRVATLRERVHDALMADRTLDGACLGTFVQPGPAPRGQGPEGEPVRAETLTVLASYAP